MDIKLTLCPFCKKLIPEDCVYCDMCGNKLRRCMTCGTFSKSKRCVKCGQPTEEFDSKASESDIKNIRPVNKAEEIQSNQYSSEANISTNKPTGVNATIRPSISKKTSIPGHLVCTSKNMRLGLGDDAIIGRNGSYGDAFQEFPSISREHAKLLKGDIDWLIEDIGSSWGTFLNNKELEKNKPTPIKVGDTLRFADIEFKVTE